MSSLRLFCLVVFASLSLSSIAQPTPQDKQRALELTEAAKADYKAKRFPEALKKFEEAYKIEPTAGRAFNLAQTHRELGQNKLAIEYFSVYLEKEPNASDRAAVEAKIEELKRLLPPEATSPTSPASLAAPVEAPAPTEPFTPSWELVWLPAAFTVGAIGFGLRAIDKKQAAESEAANGGQAIIQEGERAPVIRNALASDLCLLGASVSLLFIIKPAPIRPQLEAITQKLLPRGKP